MSGFDRQYLTSYRVPRISHRFTDLLVVGSGVAGLSAAIAAAARQSPLEVLLIAKAELEECSTRYAQGGIAAVLEPQRHSDTLESHIEDTLKAACGLARPETVALVVREGVEAVRRLIDWGTAFDSYRGELHFTREGGHSHARILHAADVTGQAIERVLLQKAASFPNLTTLTNTFAIDLVKHPDGFCCGCLVFRPAGVLEMLWAKCVVLATGGAGRLYRETTNPPVTTGDGLAMALRAGATIQDMEFVQFHPTTLYIAGADRFLITEAVRGEGGRIVDRDGEPVMQGLHPQGDLAPRDVVSRGIVQRMKETGDNKVYLDLSAIGATKIRQRFPHILSLCKSFDIDILREPIPVRPSAHYTIGGVRVDQDGATDVDRLYAVGEVSSTGLHGANRLGSNSLLEGLVYGRRAGLRAAREALEEPHPPQVFEPPDSYRGKEVTEIGHLDIHDLKRSLQSLLWHRSGIERRPEELQTALRQIGEWISYILPINFHSPSGWTLQNMLITAYLIVLGASRRQESRGVHYRTDFPETVAQWQKNQPLSRKDLGK